MSKNIGIDSLKELKPKTVNDVIRAYQEEQDKQAQRQPRGNEQDIGAAAEQLKLEGSKDQVKTNEQLRDAAMGKDIPKTGGQTSTQVAHKAKAQAEVKKPDGAVTQDVPSADSGGETAPKAVIRDASGFSLTGRAPGKELQAFTRSRPEVPPSPAQTPTNTLLQKALREALPKIADAFKGLQKLPENAAELLKALTPNPQFPPTQVVKEAPQQPSAAKADAKSDSRSTDRTETAGKKSEAKGTSVATAGSARVSGEKRLDVGGSGVNGGGSGESLHVYNEDGIKPYGEVFVRVLSEACKWSRDIMKMSFFDRMGGAKLGEDSGPAITISSPDTELAASARKNLIAYRDADPNGFGKKA